MKKRYSFFQPLWMSFYSRELYQDVARNWGGLCFLYLLFLVALLCIPQAITTNSLMKDFVEEEAPPVVEQIPRITISEGVVSTPEQKPYFIKDPERGKVFAIIDTTGEITSLDDPNVGLLVTKTELIYRQNRVETRTYDFSRVKHFVLDQDRINRWLGILEKWAAFICYPFAVIFLYIYRVLQVLLLSLVALVFAKILSAKLSYKALLSLTIIALTPALILGYLRRFAQIPIPFWGLLFLVIVVFCIFFAVKSNRALTTS